MAVNKKQSLTSKPLRLAALDGLRGIAILAVILNHIPLSIFYTSLPLSLRSLMEVFLSGGKMGVCILFLLTGFLMSWLYPAPRSAISFYSRRYARLFPAFLVMVISLSLIRSTHFPPLSYLALILGIALFARLIWSLGLKFSSIIPLGKILTISWILLQVLVALWYSFYLLKIPSPIFYQTWNLNLQYFITALINATLTLPFGNYIAQLDGVYWSLTTEVSFYLLYPILFVPVFTYVNRQKSLFWKLFLFFSTLPFCWALFFLSQRTPGFAMMFPNLAVYFIAGVAIGYNLPWFHQKLSLLPQKLFSSFTLIPLFILIFSGPLLYPITPKFFQIWISLLMVFPLGFLLISLTYDQFSFGKPLESRWLVILGKYSYSLYLTHSIVIEVLGHFIHPATVFLGVLLIIATLTLSLAMSWLLYSIIEKPYYSLPRLATSSQAILSHSPPKLSPSFRLITAFSSIIILLLYFVYHSPSSFFSSVKSYHASSLPSLLRGEKTIMLTSGQPYVEAFTAADNDLGLIFSHIRNLSSGEIPSTLVMRLFDSHYNLISQSTYNPVDVIENRYHSFGFPLQSDSKGKEYILEYRLSPVNSTGVVDLLTTENSFSTVYFFSRHSLLQQPFALLGWLWAKISEPFHNPMYWFSLINLLPFLLLLNFPLYSKKLALLFRSKI